MLRDLTERRLVFDLLFAEGRPRPSDGAVLHDRARRAIALESLRHVLGRGALPSVVADPQPFLELARDTWPEITTTRTWASAAESGSPRSAALLRRSAGFDVPDFLAAGPRDVMVPISGAATAREVLLQTDVVKPGATSRPVDPRRLLAGLLVALALGALLVWLLSLAIH